MSKSKKLSGLDKYVIFSIAIMLVFTIAEFVAACVTGMEQSTLITCFTAVFGGEVFSCALIKIFKLREENKENAEQISEP